MKYPTDFRAVSNSVDIFTSRQTKTYKNKCTLKEGKLKAEPAGGEAEVQAL